MSPEPEPMGPARSPRGSRAGRVRWIAGLVLGVALVACRPPAAPAPGPGGTSGDAGASAADPAPHPAATPGSAAPADGAVGTIVGRVVRADDLPEAGAPVTLVGGTGAARSTVSASDGRFRLDDVPAGTPLDVRIDVARGVSARIPGIRVLPRETFRLGDVGLHGPGRIEVLVTDESGAPLEGASVTLVPDATGALADVIERDPEPGGAVTATEGRTGADGRATFDVPSGPPWCAVATAPGRAREAAARVHLPAGESVRVALQLPPAARLGLRVVASDGTPVARARVAARREPEVWVPRHGWLAESRALWTHHEADAAGRVVLTGLPPGVVEILAAEPGRRLRYAASIVVPDVPEADVAIRPTAAVAGRVTARATGEPVPGVTVSFTCGAGAVVAGRTVSGADGTYRLDDVPVDGSGEDSGRRAFTVEFHAPPGWLVEGPAWSRPGALRPGETRTVDATLVRAGTVAGRVTFRGADASSPEAPVDGADVRLFVRTADDGRTAVGAATRADRDGRFTIEDAPPGRAVLFAVEPGADDSDAIVAFRRRVLEGPERDAASFDVRPGETVVRDVRIERSPPARDPDELLAEMAGRMFADHRPVLVHVRVTGEGGPPVRARVAIDVWGNAPDRDLERRVDPDGTWRQACRLPPESDAIRVVAWDDVHDDSAVAVVPVARDATEVRVDLVLPRRPVARGRVTCGGRPVAGASVVRRGTLLARSGPDGIFAVPLVTGEHEVGLVAPGCVRAALQWTVPCDAFDVELAPAGELAGVVVDAAGAPVEGVVVTPVGPDDEPAGPYAGWDHGDAPRAPTTDAQGRFRISELPPGDVRLRLAPGAGATGAVARAVVGPFAAGTTGLRVVVGAATSVSGRVVRGDGRPVRRARIEIESDDDAPEDDVSLDGRPDGDGRFTFDGLPPGTYRLVVRPAPSEELVPVSRTVRGGDVAEIVLESASEIRGTVLDDAGAPVTTIGVVAIPVGAEPPGTPASAGDLEAVTDARGEFRIVVPPRRTYRIDLVARARYMSHWFLDAVPEVPAGATGLSLGASRGIAVSGTVSDRSGTPIAGAEVTVALPAGGTRTTVTDAAGRYEFRVAGVAPQPVVVRARKDGFAPAERAGVAPGSDHVNLVLRR